MSATSSWSSSRGGPDTVYSSVGFQLAATLENLILTGTGAANATGNGLANTLTGNAGDNVIVSGGGVDMIDGGAGNDRIVVSDHSYQWARGGDGVDALVLDGAGFTLRVPDYSSNSKTEGFERFDLTGTGDKHALGKPVGRTLQRRGGWTEARGGRRTRPGRSGGVLRYGLDEVRYDYQRRRHVRPLGVGKCRSPYRAGRSSSAATVDRSSVQPEPAAPVSGSPVLPWRITADSRSPRRAM
jgi:hypothetical protein